MLIYVLGVDPGITGAFALYNGTDLDIFDVPTHEITVNKKKKRRIDLYTLSQWMIEANKKNIVTAIIENPSATPQMGVTSSFGFGFSCGVAQTIVAAHQIPVQLYHPATWKKMMSLTADKDSCRQRASQLMPKFCHLWSRAKDDGRAEAALLAYWGHERCSSTSSQTIHGSPATVIETPADPLLNL